MFETEVIRYLEEAKYWAGEDEDWETVNNINNIIKQIEMATED